MRLEPEQILHGGWYYQLIFSDPEICCRRAGANKLWLKLS